LTEDNPPAVTEVRTSGTYISTLLSILKPTDDLKLELKPNDMAGQRLLTLYVLIAGTSIMLIDPYQAADQVVSGILKNISPVPPPSPASAVDVDKEVVLPLLHPVLASLSLNDITNEAQEAISQLVSDIDLQC
jgi:hypothetical protein